MNDNKWWFLIFVIFVVLLGIKFVAWLLALAFFYWLIKTGFKNHDDS